MKRSSSEMETVAERTIDHGDGHEPMTTKMKASSRDDETIDADEEIMTTTTGTLTFSDSEEEPKQKSGEDDDGSISEVLSINMGHGDIDFNAIHQPVATQRVTCLFALYGMEPPETQSQSRKYDHDRMCHFFLFMQERHLVWHRRKTNRPLLVRRDTPDQPWFSLDPILDTHPIWNIRRELDHRTSYFHRHIVHTLWPQQQLHSWNHLEWIRQVLASSYFYRLINRPESFERMGGIPTLQTFDANEFIDKAKAIFQENGLPFFTVAHQTPSYEFLRGFFITATEKRGKMLRVAAKGVRDSKKLEPIIRILKQLPGVGPFFAWQILCDLMESRCLTHLENTASDYDTYCHLGPGAKKGLQYISPQVTPNFSMLEDLLSYFNSVFIPKLSATNSMLQLRRLQDISMKDLEHSLCEYSRYMSHMDNLLQPASAKTKRSVWKPKNLPQTLVFHNMFECGECHETDVLDNFCVLCRTKFCDSCWNKKQGVRHMWKPCDHMVSHDKNDVTDELVDWVCRTCHDFDQLDLEL